MFRAWDQQRDRLVTVKAIKLDLLPQQVIDVANALRHLAATPRPHPALVQFVDAGFEGTTPFLVMECITGETLDIALRMLASAPLARAIEMLRPLADATDASWSTIGGHGALHPRDIFIVDSDDEVRVTGAGIVAALRSAGIDVAPRRPYAAPERSGADWDQRADVYSVAAIAHELLTRRRPAGPQEQDGVFAPEITAPQRVAIRRVLARGLSEHPEDRYATASALVDALAAVQVEMQSALPFVAVAETAAIVEPEAIVAPDPIVEPVAAIEAIEAIEEAPEPVVAPVLEMAQPEDALNAEIGFEAALVEVENPLDEVVADEAVEEVLEEAAEEAAEEEPVAIRLVESAPSSPWRPVESSPALTSPMFGSEATSPVSAESKKRIGAVLVATVGLLAGGVLMYGILQRRQPAPAPAATTAAVTRPSTTPAKPSDTEVKVGGSTAPRSTDTTVPVAPPPAATRPAPATRALPRGSNDATPVKSPAGQLVVQSSPAGAMVTIDGRISGDTPLRVPDVALGAHVVQIARPGYVPRVERVTLTPAVPARTISLTLAPGLPQTGDAPVRTPAPPPSAAPPAAGGPGSLDLFGVLPRGARVSIDGERRGLIPMRIPELTPGVHTVTIESEGYRSTTTSVTIESGKRATLKLTLVPIR